MITCPFNPEVTGTGQSKVQTINKMATATATIIGTFPHPNIPNIIGIPTFAEISRINVLLNANAASVHSNLGDGRNGLLALTVTQQVYMSITGVPFIYPMNPGPIPTIPDVAAASTISTINSTHKEAQRIWNEICDTEKALKQQLIGAVEQTYLRGLRNFITAFTMISTLDILTHLYSS